MRIRKLFAFTKGQGLRVTIALLLLISIFPSGLISDAAAQTAREPITSSGSGQKEGIKVHGHWTIEVRDPDGRIVERRQFQNSLVPAGSNLLVLALFNFNRTFESAFPYIWRVQLLMGVKKLIIEESPGTFFPPPPAYSKNLVKFNDVSSLRLSGSVKAAEAGSVTMVGTALVPLGTALEFPFTEANCCPPNPPVSVIAGQTIDVTVVFSFS